MSYSIDQFYNMVKTTQDEVHKIALKVVEIETKLNNHLEHEKANTNKKLTFFGIAVGAVVGLLAIFK